VAGSYDDNESSGSITGGEFRDKLGEFQILRDCASWSQLLSFINNVRTENLVNDTASDDTNYFTYETQSRL
jgi:hypothetical protein